MAYTFLYEYLPITPPALSRIKASVFNGAVCPIDVSYGFVHGTQPARGTITFKGMLQVPTAQQVVVQVGQSVFYGMVTKNEIVQSSRTGTLTTVSLVDYRDRLLDVNVFAQFNMTNEQGLWWHTLPNDWYWQYPIYVNELQSIDDFTRNQTLPDLSVNGAKNCLPMLSSATLINALAESFEFMYLGSPQALEILETTYPENLDWNDGRKVLEAIQDICDKTNLQFTCYGDLVVYFSVPGSPENPFELALMGGLLDLCSYTSYVDSSLGAEMSDKGRRAIVLGGRNRYENWYPCVPDWPTAWTLNLVDQIGPDFSALLAANQLTSLDLMMSLPMQYQDFGKWKGKSRREMTIKDYVESIPFKVYRVDFGTALAGTPAVGAAVNDVLRDKDGNLFNPAKYNPTSISDSEFPIAENLSSDNEARHACVATSRKLWKGVSSTEALMKGERSYIDEGVEIEVIEDIKSNSSDPSQITGPECRKTYKVLILFDQTRYVARKELKLKVDGNLLTGDLIPYVEYTFYPDRVYARLATLAERYIWTQGEPTFVNGIPNPRVRENIIRLPDLAKNVLDFVESPMMLENFAAQGFVNTVYPDTVASVAATRALNHELMLNAGFITYRNSAGSMPSGIIESVNVVFSGKTGVQETINFTNVFSDNRIKSFYPMPNVRRTDRGETEQQRLAEAKNARDALRAFNEAADAGNKKAGEKAEINERTASTAAGDASTAMTEFNLDAANDDILNGDVVAVNPRISSVDPLDANDGDIESPVEQPFGVA